MKRLALLTLLLAPAQGFAATMTLTIPNAVVDRATAAFCSTYGYQPMFGNIPNPETPVQFTQRMIVKFIKDTVIGFETRNAADNAAGSQRTQTASDVGGIQ